MTFISEQIATLRGWGIPTTALDDTALTAIVNESLSEFSRYRPCIKTKTFDTVAGQQKYSWTEIGDTNGLTVQSAFWGAYSGIGPWSVANIMSASGIAIEAGDWNFPSLLLTVSGSRKILSAATYTYRQCLRRAVLQC